MDTEAHTTIAMNPRFIIIIIIIITSAKVRFSSLSVCLWTR